MDWDVASAIAEILGMGAVVVSLIYLAVQTKLTRQSAQHSSLVGVAAAHSKWRSAIYENPELADALARANAGDRLSEPEAVQIRTLHMDLFVACVVGTYTGDGDAPRAEEHYLLEIMRENPSVVREWEHQREFMELTAPKFSAEIDSRLREANID